MCVGFRHLNFKAAMKALSQANTCSEGCQAQPCLPRLSIQTLLSLSSKSYPPGQTGTVGHPSSMVARVPHSGSVSPKSA